MERDYALTYWWQAAGPAGAVREGPMGVAIRRASSVEQAEADLGRDLVSADPEVIPDTYEILSAIVLPPPDLLVVGVSTNVDESGRYPGSHASPLPEDGAWQYAGSPIAPITYAITGTEGFDDHRFVQVTHARDLHEALLAVEQYMDDVAKSDPEEVKFWSAIEVSPDLRARVWWLGGHSRHRVTLDVIEPAVGAPTPLVGVAEALDAINRHRARMGMRPLDPVAGGWTDQDIRDEAERIALLSNPLDDLKHRLI